MRPALACVAVLAAAVLAAGCGAASSASPGGGRTTARAPAASAARALPRGTPPPRALLAAGGTVRLGARTYPALDLAGLRPRRPLRILGDGRTRVRSIDLDGARHVTVSGVRVAGGVHIGRAAVDVGLVNSVVTHRPVVVRRSRGVRIDRVRIRDVALLGRGEGDGFGLWVRGQGDGASGGVVADLRVTRTCIDHLPDDGIHLSDVDGVTIADSELTRIFASVDPAIHADGIQVHDAARDVRVEDDWFHDTNRGVIVKDDVYPGFVLSGNVFQRMRAWAMDLYDTPGVRITGNVTRDQPGSSVLLHEQHGQMRDAVVTGNDLLRWRFDRSQVAREGGNRIEAPAADAPYAADDVLGMPPPAARVPAAMRACATAPR